jgi:hypothetical protein
MLFDPLGDEEYLQNTTIPWEGRGDVDATAYKSRQMLRIWGRSDRLSVHLYAQTCFALGSTVVSQMGHQPGPHRKNIGEQNNFEVLLPTPFDSS